MNHLYKNLNWKSDFWEKTNLWFNKISNNHGSDWKKGIISTLLVSIILFSLYILALSFYPNVTSKQNWLTFYNISSNMFEFINPVHKSDTIANNLGFKAKMPIFSRFIEGISRIFISYFIYQLVQAFRKHGKK